MNRFSVTAMAALALGGAVLASAPVSAMPVGALAETAAATSGIENVRWVCGPFRCWWQPNHPYYGAYAWSPRYVRPYWRGNYARPWWGRRW